MSASIVGTPLNTRAGSATPERPRRQARPDRLYLGALYFLALYLGALYWGPLYFGPLFLGGLPGLYRVCGLDLASIAVLRPAASASASTIARNLIAFMVAPMAGNLKLAIG